MQKKKKIIFGRWKRAWVFLRGHQSEVYSTLFRFPALHSTFDGIDREINTFFAEGLDCLDDVLRKRMKLSTTLVSNSDNRAILRIRRNFRCNDADFLSVLQSGGNVKNVPNIYPSFRKRFCFCCHFGLCLLVRKSKRWKVVNGNEQMVSDIVVGETTIHLITLAQNSIRARSL